MPKFRRKPVEVEAWKFDGKTPTRGMQMGGIMGINGWIVGSKDHNDFVVSGDWVIQISPEEFLACSPEVFEKTYEPVL